MQHIPATPADLGLNKVLYPEWRKYQAEAIADTVSSLESTDLVTLDMPVGTGKTLVAFGIAQMYRKRNPGAKVVFLTATNGLQDQYQRDARGSQFKLVDIRGASHYECLALSRKEFNADIIRRFHPMPLWRPNCDHGPCHIKVPCGRKEGGCLYFDQISHAKNSPMVSTNYSLWFTRILGNADLVIADEGHLLEAEIDKAARISHKDMPDSSIQKAQEWAVKRDFKLKDLEPTIAIKHERRTLKRLMSITDPDNWRFVDEVGNRGWAPVLYSNEGDMFADSFNKCVIMSGTASRADIARFRNSVRGRKLTWTFKEYPSQFPIENRPVLCYPLTYNGSKVNVTYRIKSEVASALLDHQLKIIKAMRPYERKGIIHSVSYDRARTIVSRLHADSYTNIFFADTSKGLSRTLKAFRDSPKGGILVSPSVTTGFDFPNDLCRWQLICKLPFPNTANPITRARMDIDPDYLLSQAIKILAQAVGRGTRSQDDWCETYVTDNNLMWAIQREELVPKWLRQSFTLIDDRMFSIRKIRLT